jgi:hypothetical protein
MKKLLIVLAVSLAMPALAEVKVSQYKKYKAQGEASQDWQQTKIYINGVALGISWANLPIELLLVAGLERTLPCK